jgi:hypothetical protein
MERVLERWLVGRQKTLFFGAGALAAGFSVGRPIVRLRSGDCKRGQDITLFSVYYLNKGNSDCDRSTDFSCMGIAFSWAVHN